MLKKKLLNIFQLIGIFIFFVILLNLDLHKLVRNVSLFKWEYLFYYALLTIIILSLKTYRWSLALKKQNIYLSFIRMTTIYATSSFWGIITPGKIGELIKILFIQDKNVSFARASVSVILDRLFDIVMLLFFGAVSLIYFAKYFLFNDNIIFYSIIVVLFLTLFFFLRKSLWDVIKKIIRFVLPVGKYDNLVGEWNVFYVEFKYVAQKTYYKMILITLLVYFCYYLQIYIVALGFGVSISFFYLALCLTGATIISLLPISIGGLGTKELVFIFFLSKVSVTAEMAILISLVDSTFLSLILLGSIMIVFSIITKMKISKPISSNQ